jgi:membrane protease subunit HflK
MPWNDNANPGPWGSPSGGSPSGGDKDPDQRPEGQRRPEPRRPLPSPPGGGPRLPRWAEQLSYRLNNLGGRGTGGRNNVIGAGAAVIGMLWLVFGSIYVVQVNEQAVITRFGKWVDTTPPGLHAHFPWPIEWHQNIAVTTQRNTVIGGAQHDDESLMLTSDEAIVDLDFMVQWHVSNAEAFVFNVAKPEETVKAVAESAMREVVGRSQLQAIMTNGRGQVQAQTLVLAQHILDSYHAGVSVDSIQIQSANAPQPVAPAYQELNASMQDQVSARNEGQTYSNKVVNEAKGDAARIVNAAEGYRQEQILTAEGQAAAFNQVYEQYRRAPAVTRQRLYIEAMQTILSRSNKVIIDAKGSTAPIILPPDVFRPRAPEAPAPTPTPPAQPQAAPQ